MTEMHNEKTAGAASAPNPQPNPQTPPKTPAGRPPQEEKQPVRRVGSITLGLCLMAVGACFCCTTLCPALTGCW